jgi:hypothetical protein
MQKMVREQRDRIQQVGVVIRSCVGFVNTVENVFAFALC